MMDPVATPERAKSQGEGYSSVSFVRGWYFNDGVQTPKAGGLSAPRFCSTRVQVPPCESQVSQTAFNADLSTLISKLANEIGQSVTAQLHGDKKVSESMSTEGLKPEHRLSELNLSGVKLVMQSDVKEPSVFRGDRSDKCSVCEWVEMVEIYLVKRDIPTHQQSQEI